MKGGDAASTIKALLFVVLIIIFFYVLYILLIRKSAKGATDFPSDNYMKYNGAKCPDYWITKEQDSDTVACYNKYGLKLGDDTTTCYSTSEEVTTKFKDLSDTNNIKLFPRFSTWPPSGDEKDTDAKKKRCDWMDTCGPVKNQTASSSYKPALLDCGIKIDVPPFIECGEKIIVDTRTLEYVKRVN